MALALDGTAQGAVVTSTSVTLPAFSTTNGNVIVYIAITTNGGPITSITGGSLTWASRAVSQGGGGFNSELWFAKSSSALSSVQFTINNTSNNFLSGLVFAFSGANFSSPFDGNAAIPKTFDGTGTATFTTSNANDALVTCARSNASNGSVDAPFTDLSGSTANGSFLDVGYHIVSATQSGSSVTFESGGNRISCVDAIVQASASTSAAYARTNFFTGGFSKVTGRFYG